MIRNNWSISGQVGGLLASPGPPPAERLSDAAGGDGRSRGLSLGLVEGAAAGGERRRPNETSRTPCSARIKEDPRLAFGLHLKVVVLKCLIGSETACTARDVSGRPAWSL